MSRNRHPSIHLRSTVTSIDTAGMVHSSDRYRDFHKYCNAKALVSVRGSFASGIVTVTALGAVGAAGGLVVKGVVAERGVTVTVGVVVGVAVAIATVGLLGREGDAEVSVMESRSLNIRPQPPTQSTLR